VQEAERVRDGEGKDLDAEFEVGGEIEHRRGGGRFAEDAVARWAVASLVIAQRGDLVGGTGVSSRMSGAAVRSACSVICGGGCRRLRGGGAGGRRIARAGRRPGDDSQDPRSSSTPSPSVKAVCPGGP
jgi:hypothetical protein